jgi:hypothetical protein
MTLAEYAMRKASESTRPARTVPIDEVQGDMESLRKRIQSGRAYLRVVAYPWGVEFEVCDWGDTR